MHCYWFLWAKNVLRRFCLLMAGVVNWVAFVWDLESGLGFSLSRRLQMFETAWFEVLLK